MKQKHLFLAVIALFFTFFFPWQSLAQVTLDVGDGGGAPGSSGNELIISLENPDHKVIGIQLDICEEDDYLTVTGVEAMSRTEGFELSCAECEDGCARILIFSMTLEPIEKGSGPVLIVKFDVKENAPLKESLALNLENLVVADENNQYLDVQATTPGEFFVADCKIDIQPPSKTVKSGDTIQFTASNTGDCIEEAPEYEWKVESEIGSEIDEHGLYTAGENNGDPVTDIVTVTDTANHINSMAEIIVIAECSMIIDPSEATVNSGGTIQFSANSIGDCFEPDYIWEVENEFGSKINDAGLYTAGYNDTAAPVTELVTVYDLANNVSASAEITIMLPSVRGSIKRISPRWILGSRWAPTQHFISITGKDTYFDNTSRLSFNPGYDISHFENFSVNPDEIIAIIRLNADTESGYVDVTVTTGIEEPYTVTGEGMLRIY